MKWISVEDKLPPISKDDIYNVLVVYIYKSVHSGNVYRTIEISCYWGELSPSRKWSIYDEEEAWSSHEYQAVTHWMELPSLPEEKK